jgi:uroporphyrin-III C-methyltransferase
MKTMSDNRRSGKVILAGAGPGDADLITVKLQKCLGEADIIITDRLVNPAIIERNAGKHAEILFAGKQGYNDASYTQEEINQLIIANAEKGKTVLRLKGGDIAFFSNVLDELRSLIEHHIPFEIIPGITAASGASAYAGIPLTARGYSQGVQILTFNPNTWYSSEKWKQLANSRETLVFYMAAKNVIGLAEVLLRYTRTPGTALAVIEQATTIHQHVSLTTLQKCAIDFAGKTFSSPSLVIVGDVAALHSQFHWFQSNEEAGSIFKDIIAE